MPNIYEPTTHNEPLYCPVCKTERNHRVITEHYNGQNLVARLCLWCRNFHPFTLPKHV